MSLVDRITVVHNLKGRLLALLKERNMRTDRTPPPDRKTPVKIDRNGLTWAQRHRKIEEAARIATELVKPGKTPPAPAIRKS